MKINGYGQAKVLSLLELDQLFQWGFSNNRDRCLFSICLHTGCRISEALALTKNDIKAGQITLRKQITKGKKNTRTIPINSKLTTVLREYLKEHNQSEYLFPSHHNGKKLPHLSRDAADKILREACQRIGIQGVSTHSFRRTALTQMHNAGVPLRVIQKISGHSSLSNLQRYLEVSDDAVIEAVELIGERKVKSVISSKTDESYDSFPF